MGPRRGRLVMVLATALALGRAPAIEAQSSAAAGWRSTPASVLKGVLRSAAAAQVRYRARHGAYATTADQLDVRPESGIRLDILHAEAGGWQGKATHYSQPGRSCVMFVGSLDTTEAPRTDGDHEMAGEDGIPLCDRMR